jgi:nucleotide-binding universal stress UspA family protein
MKTLLVAFDGSENAVRALEHAIDRALESQPLSSIHLVMVNPELAIHPDLGLSLPYADLRRAQMEHAAGVLEEGSRMLDAARVPHTQEVLNGHPGPIIAARADALACDGIVMGTRGMGPIGNLFLGSVATRVVHAAQVPVTLVK